MQNPNRIPARSHRIDSVIGNEQKTLNYFWKRHSMRIESNWPVDASDVLRNGECCDYRRICSRRRQLVPLEFTEEG